MYWSGLDVFVVLAETLNFTEAARRLRVSQPNVSKQLRTLESNLGVQLFLRDRKRVELTQAGRLLRETVSSRHKEILQALEEVKSGQEELTGIIRFGCLPEVGMNYFFPQLLEFGRAYPALKIDVHYLLEAEILSRLGEGKLDFGVCTRGEKSSLFRAYPVHTEEIGVIGTPNLVAELEAGKFKNTAAPWISFRENDPLVATFLQTNRRRLLFKTIDVRVYVPSHRSMAQALTAGLGFAVLPIGSVAQELRAGTLVCLKNVVRKDQLFLLEAELEFIPKRLKAFREHLLKKRKRSTNA
jgi:DNA-binding transcriptional LysR family regulator